MTLSEYGHGVVSRWWNGTGFGTLDNFRRANSEGGFHFFSPDTLRWWRSRIHDDLYGGRFFVTSDRTWNDGRAYSVREALPDGTVDTRDFQTYTSRSGAHAAAKRYARTAPLPNMTEYRELFAN